MIRILFLNHTILHFLNIFLICAVKPEIKIRIRLLGGNGSKHHDFPWIGIQNNSKFNSEANGHEARNNKSACELRTVGGWGTLFPSGCSLVRTAKDSDIKRLSPHFQIQVKYEMEYFTQRLSKIEYTYFHITKNPQTCN